MGGGDTESDLETVLSNHGQLDGTTAIPVDTLNARISEVIDASDELYFDYVAGDISDYRVANGNAHFDLNHENTSVHCVVLGFRRSQISTDLDDDLRVAVSGDLTYYEARGNCSVMVDDAVAIGAGEYQAVYEENRATLADDGLLDDARKQSLPAHPETVGVVTSLDSDAREDTVTNIHARHPDVDIVIQHATVQGENALLEMMEAISALDRDENVDVIILTRGGGAETTLRVFNETPLCRVIFNTDTPIVVGIGHERDQTLAGKVADKRVMTPTHAGAIVPKKDEVHEAVTDARARLEESFQQHVQAEISDTARSLDNAFTNHAHATLQRTRAELNDALGTYAGRELTALSSRLDHAYASLEQATQYEQEKAAAKAAVRSKYQRQQRIQRAAIAVLGLLLVLALAYLLLR